MSSQRHIKLNISYNVFKSFLKEISSCELFARSDWVLNQGPLKKWTKHSQELHLLKIHSRGGAPNTPRGWMGVDFLDHELL